ncbi:peptidase S28 [Mycena galericulata]|nr:peptidase S28 [Mycena galericulata]
MLPLAWIIAGTLAAVVPLSAVARPPVGLAIPKQPPFSFTDSQASSLSTANTPVAYFFDQILGKGEEDASLYTGYLLNETITGAIAYAVGGATIVMEHRYWGASIPAANYSTANMKYFTIQNAVQDFAYFALNVELPFTTGTKATPPPNTPWIVAGGSYPGVLSAYVKHTFPDLFYAAYATSAPVQAISNLQVLRPPPRNQYLPHLYSYGYFIPVENGAPQNCSTDMKAVITHWDAVMSIGAIEQQLELMAVFGLQNVTHSVDAAYALQLAPFSWQDLAPAAGAGQEFFDFCDTLEVKDGVSAGPDGYGLEYALAQWGTWQLQANNATCGDAYAGDECWGTFDPTATFYTDVDTNNTYRPWMWLICSDLALWQTGDPTAPSIVSKQVNVAYWERQCPLYFPAEDGVSIPQMAPVDEVNALYDGWDITEDRLLFVNGQFDPWRSGGVASELPDAPQRQSTAEQPLLMVETGVHCWDMITSIAQANPNTRVVFDQVVAQMVQWMEEWDEAH